MREVRHGDAVAIKRELMTGLGIKARQTFAKHRDGRTKEMTVVNKEIIERIFRAYGVDNPWGD